MYKFWPLRSKSQVTSSGQSQMCIVMCTPTSNFKMIVLWPQFYSECFDFFRMNYWNGYLQNVCIFRIFHCSDLRSGKFSTRSNITPWGNYYSAHNFWTKVIDEWNWYQSACPVALNQMIPGQVWSDLTYDQIGLEVKLLNTVGYHSIILTRETWFCSLILVNHQLRWEIGNMISLSPYPVI